MMKYLYMVYNKIIVGYNTNNTVIILLFASKQNDEKIMHLNNIQYT